MRKSKAHLVLLLVFFVFSNSINFASAIDNKKEGAGKGFADESHIFYYSSFHVGSFIQARMDIPETPKQIGETTFPYLDCTIDENGVLWGSLTTRNVIKRKPLNNSINYSTFALDGLGIVTPFTGIAFNPVDKNIYALCFYAASWHIAKYKVNTNSWELPPVIIPGLVNCKGLACSNTGVFYTIEQDGNNLNLYSINATTGVPTFIGVEVLDNDGRDISLEIDRHTNKCYLSTYNKTLTFDELDEVNLTNGHLTRQHQFSTYLDPTGIAFYHGLLFDLIDGTLESNTETRIRWNICGHFNINLDYSYDGGVSWNPIATNYNGNIDYYDWLIPHVESDQCQFRATRVDNPDEVYYSETFTIQRVMPIFSPDGGEVWNGNSQQPISWGFMLFRAGANIPEELKPLQKAAAMGSATGLNKATGLPGISINLYYRESELGEWILIAKNVPYDFYEQNTYMWTVPDISSSECRVKIELEAEGVGDAVAKTSETIVFYSISDECFTIVKSTPVNGKYNITSPNGGETLQGGAAANITWRRNGIVPGTIQLQYSADRGATWQNINTTPIAGVLRYSWMVPRVNSTKCLVRMINPITKIEYDRSNSPFTITTSAATVSNFPNPFNPSTKIVFGLENKAKVSLRVYNSLGQQVAELVNSQLEPGEHGYEFNASNLPSGVYIYDLNINGKSQVSKMILMK